LKPDEEAMQNPQPAKLPPPNEVSMMLTLDIQSIAMEAQRDFLFNRSKILS